MITLDGVMQAPGAPDEDTSGGFRYGGWTAPFADANVSEILRKNMQPAAYLLGRKTFDILQAIGQSMKMLGLGLIRA